MHQAERGLFELRRGRIVCVQAPDGAALVATVEGLRSGILDDLLRLASAPPRLVVTHHRAKAMGLAPESANGASTHPNGRPDLALGLARTATPEGILRLATATSKAGPNGLAVGDASAAEASGLTLARLGRLLPAVVAAPAGPPASDELRAVLESEAILRAPAAEVAAMAGSPQVEITPVSDARVPLRSTNDARVMLFREGNGLFEHVAVVIGSKGTWDGVVPVRVHSACLTGDLFGSLRCDCGEQLRGSLDAFAENGGGILLYLAQEGRNIGLGNKLRAYTMQEEGLDTIDADCALGFGADERRYEVAVEILRHLEVDRIRLFTNNPEKVRAMENGGIEVADRTPLHGTLTPENLPYVSAKAQRAGHWMDEMLSRRIQGR